MEFEKIEEFQVVSIYEKLNKPWESEPFLDFSPMTGEVASHPFELLPLITDRARSVLSRRSEEVVVDAAYFIEDAVRYYFEYIREEILAQLFNDFPELNEDFDLDSKLEEVARMISLGFFSEEVKFQIPELPTRKNISDFEVLKELQYSLLHHPGKIVDMQLHEYFAVLALRYVDDCMKTVSQYGVVLDQTFFQSAAAKKCIEHMAKPLTIVVAAQPFAYAMECVNYAEHLEELYRRNIRFENEVKTVRNLAEEHANKVMTEHRRKGGFAKNIENNQIRDEIKQWYKANHHRFKTQKEAAEAATKIAPISVKTALKHIKAAKDELQSKN